MSTEAIAPSAPTEIRQSAGVLIAMGIAMVILGFLAVGAPLASGVAVTYMIGGVITVTGLCQLFSAFKAPSWGLGILGVLLGAFTLIAGVLVLGHPLLGLGFLTLLLASYFLVEGVFEIVHGLQLRPLPGWGWGVFNGVVALMLGLMIWRQWPLSGAWALGLLVGIKILLSGTSMIAVGVAARSVTRA